MAKKPVAGVCHICGTNGPLSFEHVPPKAAFNNRPLILEDSIAFLEDDPDKMRRKRAPRGAGAYSLCIKCNNATGRWYGRAYVEWAYQAMSILRWTHGEPSLYYTFHIFPLRVIKQVLCMFFSINGDRFWTRHPELVRFVLNPRENGLNPCYGIYAFFLNGNVARQSGVSGSLDIGGGGMKILSEMAFPPIGYVMTFSSQPPDERLVDISFMAKYRYNDWKSLSFRLPVLPVCAFSPGDYRDRKTIRQEANQVEPG